MFILVNKLVLDYANSSGRWPSHAVRPHCAEICSCEWLLTLLQFIAVNCLLQNLYTLNLCETCKSELSSCP